MENYLPSNNMLPLQNIIKSHLVIFQHSNEKLCAETIEILSLQILETLESYLNKNNKDEIVRHMPGY